MGLVPLLLVAEQGRIWGWGSGRSITCYVIGGIGVVAFFLAERMMGDEALLPIKLFQNRTVGISSIASVILGMGLFGGIACLPLYLQIVKGASPTAAGLLLLPMTLGIMTGSIVSGQMISRTGRYRHFPIIGSALLVIALFGFHYIGADTPLWRTMILMVVFGVGLGFNMQPLTLAVQNAVNPRDIGVATSSATFTRQIGGTIGTAVFLSILFSAVPDRLQTAFRTIAPSSDFQAALKAPQGDAGRQPGLHLGAAGAAVRRQRRRVRQRAERLLVHPADRPPPRPAVPGRLLRGDRPGVPHRVGRDAVAFVVLWFLPNVELRSGSSYAERGRSDAADADAAAVPPAVAH